jgi:hypothetical protein
MASSVPGSVSKMIFLPVPEAGEARIADRKTRRRREPKLLLAEK